MILFALGLLVSSVASASCVIVDGPANYRSSPGGKVIGSIPDKASVLTGKDKFGDSKKGDWIYIFGFQKKKNDPPKCISDDPVEAIAADEPMVSGWIHTKNIKKLSFLNSLSSDFFGVLKYSHTDGATVDRRQVIAKGAVVCGKFAHLEDQIGDESMVRIQFKTGERIGRGCILNAQTVECVTKEGPSSTSVFCPLRSVELRN